MESLKFSATAKLLLLLLWVSEGEGMRTCGGGGRGRGLRLRTLSADSGTEFWSKLQPTVSSYIFGPVFNLSFGAFCLLWVCFVSLQHFHINGAWDGFVGWSLREGVSIYFLVFIYF